MVILQARSATGLRKLTCRGCMCWAGLSVRPTAADPARRNAVDTRCASSEQCSMRWCRYLNWSGVSTCTSKSNAAHRQLATTYCAGTCKVGHERLPRRDVQTDMLTSCMPQDHVAYTCNRGSTTKVSQQMHVEIGRRMYSSRRILSQTIVLLKNKKNVLAKLCRGM